MNEENRGIHQMQSIPQLHFLLQHHLDFNQKQRHLQTY